MHGVNRDRVYDATATGVVRQSADGAFYEDLGWTSLVVDGKTVTLSPDQLAFRQQLSIDLRFQAPFPDLRTAHPRMIGPILDLMTFYADLKLAVQRSELVRAGDHAHVAYGKPSSWANPTTGVILGEDSIDFDLTLTNIDAPSHSATLLVKHVPPTVLSVSLPATWMQPPVIGSFPNNWVQVAKARDAGYVGAVGHESFDVELTVELGTGKLIAAKMVNPVDVLERECADAALSSCKEPSRYQIMRRIELTR
jgi:hypothetical protein